MERRHLHARDVRQGADAGGGVGNFAAKLDNSAPRASPFDVAVVEDGGPDGCSAIPKASFAEHATDWDNDGLGRGQTLNYRVSDVDNLRGALYSDATCTTAYETGAPIGTTLYYKPPADENSLGGPFTTVTGRWTTATRATTLGRWWGWIARR